MNGEPDDEVVYERAGPFQITIDDEGVCRVVNYPHETMTFTPKDFGVFLTRLLEMLGRDEDVDVVDLD